MESRIVFIAKENAKNLFYLSKTDEENEQKAQISIPLGKSHRRRFEKERRT